MGMRDAWGAMVQATKVINKDFTASHGLSSSILSIPSASFPLPLPPAPFSRSEEENYYMGVIEGCMGAVSYGVGGWR